ncbi:hypothetical protein L0Y69_02635 [bacterium]|nr:hypothetical protein [bacterium]
MRVFEKLFLKAKEIDWGGVVVRLGLVFWVVVAALVGWELSIPALAVISLIGCMIYYRTYDNMIVDLAVFTFLVPMWAVAIFVRVPQVNFNIDSSWYEWIFR